MRSNSKHVIAIIFVMMSVELVTPSVCVASSGLGVKGGLAFARQDFCYADPKIQFKNDYRRGFGAGLFVEQSLMPFLAVRAEGMYIQKGFKTAVMVTDLEGIPAPHTADLYYRIDFIALNLLGKISLPSKTYLLAGPRLDIKLSTNNDPPTLIPTSLEDKFSKTVYGWTFGIGQEVPIAPKLAFFIEGQLYADQGYLYDHTLQGTDKIGTLATIRNKSFALFAGVRF